MDRCEIEMLGQYNSETARGIMHTDEWSEKMARLQRKFNLQQYGTEAPEPGMVYMRPAPVAQISAGHSNSFTFQQLVAENAGAPSRPNKRCNCPGGALGWHNDCPLHGLEAQRLVHQLGGEQT